MLRKLPYFGFVDDSLITVTTLENASILESAMDALGSGEAIPDVVTTASTYTHSIIAEILENAKEALIQLAQKVLSIFNNFIVNDIKIMEKYRDIILSRISEKSPVMIHETYEYPAVKDFPRVIKGAVYGERNITNLQDKLTGPKRELYSPGQEVDRLLEQFGQDILGERIDPNNIRESVRHVVQDKVRGNAIRIRLDRHTFATYLDQISTYKTDKDDIIKTKKAVIEDYEMIKKTYSKVTKRPDELATKAVNTSDLKGLASPQRQMLYSIEYQRFADIHMEMTRLFNGFITIYETAFDTKLNELKMKIEDRKNVVTEVLTRTGLFTSINPRNVDPGKTPIKYIPLRT